jgi:transcriptional regulator with XRE-family HTH domain
MDQQTDRTDKQFPQALQELMRRRSISYRGLAEACNAIDRPLSHAYLNHLGTGREKKPTPGNMEAIAQALGVPPTYWREYREHLAGQRARALAARHGLDAVLSKLAELDAG